MTQTSLLPLWVRLDQSSIMPLLLNLRPLLPHSDIPDGKSSLLDKIRALAFFLWSLTLAVPLFIIMAVMSPLVLALDKYKRLAQHFVNNVWAKISTSLFYRVEIQGRENLPPPDKPVVYVANHQSFLDIYSLFHLDRPFKFISKTSIFMIPIVGWSMFLTGHVGLKRTDRKSQLECLKQCRDLLGKGAPVLFFPEGTRSPDCVMAGFKKGAFSVAVKAGVDVVPITLLGTGVMMPSGSEGLLKGGRVKIVVHPPIKTTGRDADEVCSESREIIAKSMPKALIGSATKMAADES
jgi:1-acyl-sn-glycerol-3-phosphate acyltransferase